MMDTNQAPPGAFSVDFTDGGAKRTAILTINAQHKPDGTVDLGVSILVPVSVPGSQQATYKPVGAALNITPTKRDEIIAALAGKQSKGPNDEGTKSGDSEGEGASSVAPNQQHPRRA